MISNAIYLHKKDNKNTKRYTINVFSVEQNKCKFMKNYFKTKKDSDSILGNIFQSHKTKSEKSMS